MLTVLIVIAVIVIGVLVAASMRPNSFAVQRSAQMRAAPDAIYPLIADFREWPRWSPWEKLDPNMKRTLSGAPSGTGAIYAWEGSGKVGAGRMEIRDVAPPSKVVIQLDFIKPFEGHNTAEFTLQPQGDSTEVTWAMYGPAPYFHKLIGLFLNMDQMIGKDFESGLQNLKAVAEK